MSDKARQELHDEKELINRLRNGHEGAFRILMQTHQERLYRIAFGITQDREESLEIVQEVFISVFKHIKTFKGDAKLATWLHRLTVNESLNWKRRWKRRFKWDHQPLEEEERFHNESQTLHTVSPDKVYDQMEAEQKLQEHLMKLPEKIRAVFVLHVFEGLSYDEIAILLNIKKGTVSSRLFKARKQLVAALH